MILFIVEIRISNLISSFRSLNDNLLQKTSLTTFTIWFNWRQFYKGSLARQFSIIDPLKLPTPVQIVFG